MALIRDLRYALRGLWGSPGYTATCVAVIALGIGANAAIFSVVHSVILKALPYEVREGDITFCHGSPINLEEFEYIFSVEQATKCLDIWDDLGVVTFIGHSHLCKSFALTREEVFEVVATKFVIRPEHRYIISVGSVGQPRDFDNRASFTVYDTVNKSFEFKRIEYDIELAADKVLRARLERNFAHRLFIGV